MGNRKHQQSLPSTSDRSLDFFLKMPSHEYKLKSSSSAGTSRYVFISGRASLVKALMETDSAVMHDNYRACPGGMINVDAEQRLV